MAMKKDMGRMERQASGHRFFNYEAGGGTQARGRVFASCAHKIILTLPDLSTYPMEIMETARVAA